MTIEEYREKVNPCFGYGCYDDEVGCTMPDTDKLFACPIEKEDDND